MRSQVPTRPPKAKDATTVKPTESCTLMRPKLKELSALKTTEVPTLARLECAVLPRSSNDCAAGFCGVVVKRTGFKGSSLPISALES